MAFTKYTVHQPQPPKFKVGDVVSRLTVDEYLGWKPSTEHVDARSSHKYRCTCECGEGRVVAQEYLHSIKQKVKQCSLCARVRKNADRSKDKAEPTSEAISTAELLRNWRPTRT